VHFCPYCERSPLTPLRKGGFLCEDCDRRIDVASALARPRASVPRVVWDDPALPFAVAHPIGRARDESLDLGTRLDAAVFAAYQIIRTSGLLLLSDYLATNTPSRKVHMAIRALRAPDWWAWTVMCNQLCRFFSGDLGEAPERPSSFPKLTQGWRSFNRKATSKKDTQWRTLLDGLSGRDGAAHSANDALWRARDDRERRGAEPKDELLDRALIERLLGVLDASVQRLFPKDAFELLRRIDVRGEAVRVVRLHGSHLDGRFPVEMRAVEWGESLALTGTAAVISGSSIPIHPMFLRLDPETYRASFGAGGFLEPIAVDAGDAMRTAVLGPEGKPPPPSFSAALSAFRKKRIDFLASQADVAPAALYPFATASLAATEDALRGRSYFPETYVERQGLDDVLDSTIEISGRALLLLGAAGAGKTSLFARVAAKAAGDAGRVQEPGGRRTGDLVVLLTGRTAYSAREGQTAAQTLTDAVCRKLGVREGTFRTLSDLLVALEDSPIRGETPRRVFLFLDSVDEADDVEGVVAAIDELLPALAKHSTLRVLVAMRTAAYQRLPVDTSGGTPARFSNARFLAHFYDHRARSLVPYLDAQPFDPVTELPHAYATRQQKMPRRACTVPFASLPPDLVDFLALPLSLHLFHDARTAYRPGEAVPDEGGLHDAFLRTVDERVPRASEWLADLGEALLRHRSLDVLSPERLVHKRKQAQKPPGADVDLDRMVDAGLLSPPLDEVRPEGAPTPPYTFAHPSLCDDALIRAFERRIAPRKNPTGKELAEMGTLAAGGESSARNPFYPLVRALESLVRRMAARGEVGPLAWLLTIGDAETRDAVVGAVLRWLGPVWGPDREGSPVVQPLMEVLTKVASDARLAPHLVASSAIARAALEEQGHVQAARALERLSLRAIRTQIAASPEDIGLQLDLGRALGALSRLSAVEGRMDEARKLGNEALRVRKKLSEERPHEVETTLAVGVSLLEQAALAETDGKPRDARRFAREGLEVLRSAEALDPHREDVQRELASVLERLGALETGEGQLTEADARLREALAIRRRLSANDRQRPTLLLGLASTLRAVGDLEIATARTKDARRHLEDAAGMLRTLAAREPYWIEVQRDLWATLRVLGNLARAEGRRDDAKRLLDETLEGLRWLGAHDPLRADVRGDLATSLVDVANLAFLEGKRGRARRLLEEAADILRELIEREGEREEHLRHLASALTNLGNVARVEGKHQQARAYFEEATSFSSRLVAREPDREERVVELANLHWSSYLIETDPEARQRHVDNVITLLRPLRERSASSPQLLRLWDLAAKAGDAPPA
jgi:tetratricopeptide (TPR) repeat protein